MDIPKVSPSQQMDFCPSAMTTCSKINQIGLKNIAFYTLACSTIHNLAVAILNHSTLLGGNKTVAVSDCVEIAMYISAFVLVKQ